MQPLSPQIIEQLLDSLPGWSLVDDALVKGFTFSDFSEALAFIVRVGIEAEKAVHHPDLRNVYNRVEIRLSTHDAGNRVTQKDAVLAKNIERLV